MVVKMEHVLILLIAVFLLYHFVGRCRCNGFSVGGTDYCVASSGTEECYNKCKEIGYSCRTCWNACADSNTHTEAQRLEKVEENYGSKVHKCTDEASYDPDDDDKFKFYEKYKNFAIHCKPGKTVLSLYTPCLTSSGSDAVSYIGPQL